MTRDTDWPLLTAVGGLLVALLVCICLLAFPAYNNKTGQAELEVAKQEYTRQLFAMDRKYEQKVNSLQEQITSIQFVANKRYEIAADDIRRLRNENQDFREKLQARSR
jgi:Skp family chaperone for outer membrane proteins